MATSFNRSTASGLTDTFPVSFPYLDKSHVSVSLNGAVLSPSSYTWPTDASVKITAGNPTAGTIVERRRSTPSDPLVTFQPGNLEAGDLNTGDLQSLYISQEAKDRADDITARAWVTAGFLPGGTIGLGTEGSVLVYDSDGNLEAGPNVTDIAENAEAATEAAAAAQGSATAAADSASLASGAAGSAAASASDAASSATSASSSKDAAAGSATAAASSASSASGSATTASTAATTATSAKTAAESARDTAVSSASAASGSATSAAGSATTATNAKNDAVTAKDTAQAIVAGIPTTNNNLVKGTGTGLTSITPADAYDLLDPLSTFAADGVTSDQARFTALRSRYPKLKVDLKCATYLVTSTDLGPMRNGFLKRNNAVGGMAVEYPMEDTLEAASFKVTEGGRYSSWPQDKCFWYKGVLYCVWNEGTSHTSLDTHPRMARSFDGGQTWTEYQELFEVVDRETWAAAAGVVDGQMVIAVRERTLSPSTVTAHKLYGKRLREHRAAVSARVFCGIGGTSFRIYIDDAGLKVGDRITLQNASGVTVGGQNVNNCTFTVSSNTNTFFNVTFASGGLPAATADDDKTVTFDAVFMEDDFAEIKIGANDIGTALVAFGGVITGLPTILQSFATVKVAGEIYCYLGISGGLSGGGAGLIELKDILRGSGTFKVNAAVKLSATADGTAEASVTVDPATGNLFGFLRAQTAGSRPMGWFSLAANRMSPTTYLLPTGDAVGYLSPIPCRVLDGKLFAFLVGDRTNGGNPGQVPAHLLVADCAALVTAGAFSAFRVIYLGGLNKSIVVTSDAVGIASMAVDRDNKRVYAFYSEEGGPLPNGSLTAGISANIGGVVIGVQPLLGGTRSFIQQALGGNSIKSFRGGGGVAAEKAYLSEALANNTPVAWGQIAADGSLVANSSYNVASVTKGGTGLYTVNFLRPISGLGIALVSARWTANQLNAGVSSQPSATDFGYRVRDVANVLTDAPVNFVVYARREKYRIGL